MKKTLFLFLILATTKSMAQIYFSPNAYMYVKDEVLFVQQNVNLAANSNLYLRNNSQLVQGATTASTNTGAGTLSVYQEGTSDNFDYNYWCSPVGTASATIGNENFGITMLSRPTTSIASTPATIISGYDGVSNPLSISSAWIHKLTNANNYSNWVFVGGASTLAPGEGFTMKGTSGTDTTDPEATGITNNPGGAQRYDFIGKPNDGNITIALGANNSTLTGNPYPSALHLNAFLLDASNAATGGVAYFWEQDKAVNSHYLTDYRGGYGTYTPTSLTSTGVYVPATFNSYNGDGSLNNTGSSSGITIVRKYSPIGQGFVINATANGTAIFKNVHRFYYKEGGSLSKFEKKAPVKKAVKSKTTKEKNAANNEAEEEEEIEEVSHFKLNTIINNQFTRQLALSFLEEATDGVDLGIDALNMDESLPNDVTFWLENGNYVIQGINFDIDKKVPLTVKVATNTSFKFYVPEITNFDPTQIIYLYDGLDDSYHDIKNGMYEVTVAPGVYADRFKITFKNQTTLGTDDNIVKQFFITQDNANGILKASNPNNLSLKSFKLYDVMGKVVLTKKGLGTNQSYTFSTTTLSQGIYIAEFITVDNERLTEKIIITNKGY
ncbi:T9SS type A sorting domain-containing protein [Flavobacterium hercynium]|uniref:Secretion protein n=1 Tax=Flavobacterium hercynium TaxID=387094 RepID=A0A226HH15_9FLAO|nr:T9SS type A sorting domain-containing protein [Flavobacterium hercynium]OXA93158.1 secretion protein [Flavobacterium hercynium]SMP32790.1 Por secretion system C-terminal sorting domain-containing protein [Flavobacterium hercynium]